MSGRGAKHRSVCVCWAGKGGRGVKEVGGGGTEKQSDRDRCMVLTARVSDGGRCWATDSPGGQKVGDQQWSVRAGR